MLAFLCGVFFSDAVVEQVLGQAVSAFLNAPTQAFVSSFMAIQLENISQKQKEMFWFHPAIKIP